MKLSDLIGKIEIEVMKKDSEGRVKTTPTATLFLEEKDLRTILSLFGAKMYVHLDGAEAEEFCKLYEKAEGE